jgi:Raf kinase inhibitor-like YbhB/YbcL family protein
MLTLMTEAFGDGESIPSKYTCDGEGVSPQLLIGDVPEKAQSLALIVHDPDVPTAIKPDGVFDHWVLFNIPPDVDKIPEGDAGSIGVEGNNGAGKLGYTPPCPPSNYQPSRHRYVFTLYALDIELPLKTGASKAEVLEAMDGHILAQTQLVGTYEKQK